MLAALFQLGQHDKTGTFKSYGLSTGPGAYLKR